MELIHKVDPMPVMEAVRTIEREPAKFTLVGNVRSLAATAAMLVCGVMSGFTLGTWLLS